MGHKLHARVHTHTTFVTAARAASQETTAARQVKSTNVCFLLLPASLFGCASNKYEKSEAKQRKKEKNLPHEIQSASVSALL